MLNESFILLTSLVSWGIGTSISFLEDMLDPNFRYSVQELPATRKKSTKELVCCLVIVNKSHYNFHIHSDW